MKDTEDHFPPDEATGYPGDDAPADDIFALAEVWATTARGLLQNTEKTGARPDLARHPARFCALHAIELYLKALLRSAGTAGSAIRGFHHDIGKYVETPPVAALKLRKKTLVHLTALHNTREYLVYRYAPDWGARVSEQNRLLATLDELSGKIGKVVAASKGP